MKIQLLGPCEKGKQRKSKIRICTVHLDVIQRKAKQGVMSEGMNQTMLDWQAAFTVCYYSHFNNNF